MLEKYRTFYHESFFNYLNSLYIYAFILLIDLFRVIQL